MSIETNAAPEDQVEGIEEREFHHHALADEFGEDEIGDGETADEAERSVVAC